MKSTLRAAVLGLAVLALTDLVACSGSSGGSASSSQAIQIQPTSMDVAPGDVVKFDAVVSGSSSLSIGWQVVESDGGTIDAAGHYTAPAAEGTYHVVASLRAAAPASESAEVHVKRRAATSVMVSPTAATLSIGQSVSFTATVDGAHGAAVTWSVQEGAAGGTVTLAGVYTAPQSAGTYHVVVTSAVDPTKSDAATLTVDAPAPPPPAPPPGIVPAFRGAQGGGALSVGGRGGTVIQVTNLNDSGTGSLRACMQATGPRTCVFKVSGVITLSSAIYLGASNSYLTVAGQTAPGGGIAIAGGTGAATGSAGLPSSAGGTADMFVVEGAHDVTMRYLRFWRAYNANAISSSMKCGQNMIVYQGYNLILDHITAVWAMDKSISLWPTNAGDVTNVTISYGIVGEGVGSPGCYDTGLLTGSDTLAAADSMTDIDLHHNYFANANHRFPLFKSKSGRLVNNAFFNWESWATGIGGGAAVDLIGNYWLQGPSYTYGASIPRPISVNNHDASSGCTSCGPSGTPSLYLTNNVGPGQLSVGANDWDNLVAYTEYEGASQCGYPAVLCSSTSSTGYHPIWIPDGRSLPAANSGAPLQSPGSINWKRTTPLLAATAPAGAGNPPSQSDKGIPISAITLTGNGQNLLSALLPDTAPQPVGASQRLDCDGNWVLNRDASDERIVGYVLTNPSSAKIDQSRVTDYNAGGFPALAAGSPCADTDGDGIPDAYEIAHGLNPNDPSDGSAIASDGFSNLERYLSGN